MSDLHDYELQHEYTEPPPEKPQQPIEWWIAGGLLLVAAAAALYLTFGKRLLPAPVTTTAGPTAVAKEPRQPLGGEGELIAVPPLAESDPLVRKLVRMLSNHQTIAAWLATNGLIRNFTVAVSNIAEGVAPAKQLSALRPSAAFNVVERSGKSYVDPKSYDRYATLADGVASVDPAGAARLYATLKPRIEEAAGELGIPPGQFDQVLEQAIVVLLRTPVLDGSLPVRPNDEGIGYGFADGRLERLSAAQKPLVRMGPRNARIVKTKLRDIALALGIPSTRLPAQ